MYQPVKCLLLMLSCVSFSWAFIIDLRNPEFYTARDFLLKDVLPVRSEQKGILVTAPLFVNGSGAVYCREQSKEHAPFAPKVITLGFGDKPIRHVAFSKANASTMSQITVCSPVAVTEHYENPYIKKLCYDIQGPLQEPSSFTPAFQECLKKRVDIVFLFDGSRNLSTSAFHKNKQFIEDIMTKLQNTSITTTTAFAAVQFSTGGRSVFTFNDYIKGDARGLLKKEEHMMGLTNTYSAMNFTLNKHFENPENGTLPEATKVLVLITDGDPSDKDNGIIETYDSKNIIRFVIGVRDVSPDKLVSIASKPQNKHIFYIESDYRLGEIVKHIEKKIFETALVGDLTVETSRMGLNAVVTKDALVLVLEGSERDREYGVPQMKEDCYMGYSVSVGKRNNTALCFSGSPRNNHMGQVILFTATDNKWTQTQRIIGEQHGSYFGAEVCSVDVDSDGSTDFLLVGAPLFYQPHEKREGKIYIYRLTEELKLKKINIEVTAPAMGRFGTTITSVADLNGDGLRDIAVGAPLENLIRGAVYLYLGDRRTGIRSVYSQRIMGEKIRPELRFFGQSIDGSIDLGDDGLPDLVVGSQGLAVILRSKPVFSVTAHLSIEPKEISIENINCPSNKDDFLPLVTLKICFEMIEATKSSAAAVKPGLNISYTLDVDPMRQTFRGFFNSTTKRRNLTETLELRDRETCFNRSVYMPKCVTDILSPVKIKMDFSQVNSELADAVLNADSENEASVEVPFKETSVIISGNRKNDNSAKVYRTENTITKQFGIKAHDKTCSIGEDTTNSLNFTTEDSGPKRLGTKYKVDNRGCSSFPVNVTLFFPTKLEHTFEMSNYQVFVEQNTTQCKETHTAHAIKSEYCTPERECKYIVCDTFILNNASAVEFGLCGEVQFKDLSRHNIPLLKQFTGYQDRIKFKSFLHVTHDTQKHGVVSDSQKSEIEIELIVFPDKMLIIVTAVGAGLLLIFVIFVIVFMVRYSKKKMHYMVEEQRRKQLETQPNVKLKAEVIELKDDKEFLITGGANCSG